MKNLLLSSTRVFDAPNDQGADTRSEAQKQRDSIKVESIKKHSDPAGNQEDEDDGEKNKDKGNEGEVKTGDEEDEEEIDEEDDKNKDKDEAETPEALKKQIETLQRQVNRLQKRQGKTASERDRIAQQLQEAQAALNSKVEEGKGLSEEEVERRANIKAEEKSAEREFNKAVNTLNRDAKKVDKDFPTKIKELTDDIAPVPGAMIGVLEDLDNGGAVLAYLASNPEEYEDIYDLPLTRMATRLSKISDKLIEEGKPKPKPVSKTPQKINPLKGSETSPSQLPSKPTENMADFVKQRNIQVAERRKARGY